MAKKTWGWVFLIVVLVLMLPLVFFSSQFFHQVDVEVKTDPVKNPKNFIKNKTHLDHSAFFSTAFQEPQEVTKACLKCHKDSAHQLMKTSHWTWLADEVLVNRGNKPIKIGKKNLINNFCLGVQSNWPACTKCHAGYGWKDDSFDFSKRENVDCLICHDGSGTYSKDKAGLPSEGVDLLKVAKGVHYPQRENCGICHFYGGGGLGVKHGDLDNSLVKAKKDVDVHMGKYEINCIDCHRTEKHMILGKSRSNCSSCSEEQTVSCTDCHSKQAHRDERINKHLDSVACQTCHIPKYAKVVPTKMDWDWSKAGDMGRQDDPHKYLKIKGEFKYEKDLVPEYYWFDGTIDRYLLGDKIDPNKEMSTGIEINKINGKKLDPKSKIFPFKIHTAKQPYDKKFNYLLIPKTAGPGGYWSEFNWQKAFQKGAEATGLNYSGEYDFVSTKMYWPLSHMVSPKEDALKCINCHDAELGGNNQKGKSSSLSRLNWKALGYEGDPMRFGKRILKEAGKNESEK